MSNRLHSDARDSSLSHCLPPVITQNMWFPISPEIPTFLCLPVDSCCLQDGWFPATWPLPLILCSYLAICLLEQLNVHLTCFMTNLSYHGWLPELVSGLMTQMLNLYPPAVWLYF